MHLTRLGCVLLLCAASLAGQKPTKGPGVDRYTGGSPERMARAGYVSFGPFTWDGRHSTADLATTLGEPRLLFVETAHFKIGCCLAPREAPRESHRRRQLQAELRRLKRRLPRVRTRPRELDRWLLLHLTAQRLEELYASFSQLLGVEPGDFPRAARRGTDRHYMGEGAYLGQRAKYCVILFDRETQLARYLRAFAGIAARPVTPRRHEFSTVGSLAFATASSCHNGMLLDTTHMHAHLVDEVVKNLTVGYKNNLIELPHWWVEGLGHYYRRQLDPKINFLGLAVDPLAGDARGWDWSRRVRGRVKNGHFLTADDLVRLPGVHRWKAQEHMMAWSRVEFLLRTDPKGARRFLDYLNDLEIPIRSSNHRADVQTAALQQGWKLDLAAFDDKWQQHVRRRDRK